MVEGARVRADSERVSERSRRERQEFHAWLVASPRWVLVTYVVGFLVSMALIFIIGALPGIIIGLVCYIALRLIFKKYQEESHIR